MWSKEMSVELRDRIVSRHRSGEGFHISAALNVPKNTVASIILKRNKFGITKTLSKSWPPGQTEQSGEKVREPSGRTTISAALHQSGLYGRVARQKPLLIKRHMTAHLEYAKTHLKD